MLIRFYKGLSILFSDPMDFRVRKNRMMRDSNTKLHPYPLDSLASNRGVLNHQNKG